MQESLAWESKGSISGYHQLTVILSTDTNQCIARRLTITWTWLSLTKHVDPFLCCLHTSFELSARLDLSNSLTGALATNAVRAHQASARAARNAPIEHQARAGTTGSSAR